MPRVNYKGGARDYYVIGYRRRERAEISWVPLLENSTAFDSQEVRLYQSLDRAVLIHFEDMCVNTLEEKNPKVWKHKAHQQAHLHKEEEELGGRELIDSQ
ncbi:uncharacterized protein LOC132046143 isoform X2 [Lycium ferocissimum]|uniref:uncharacterized protein LOC132046143 isoform X2 n=1 Tax=Lycium ferocissimum TaxID=112874 RepID=UPI0028158AAF|nr:uncharacterized protein LOC132046143 isoform X2 [Lycium ferocissimum]